MPFHHLWGNKPSEVWQACSVATRSEMPSLRSQPLTWQQMPDQIVPPRGWEVTARVSTSGAENGIGAWPNSSLCPSTMPTLCTFVGITNCDPYVLLPFICTHRQVNTQTYTYKHTHSKLSYFGKYLDAHLTRLASLCVSLFRASSFWNDAQLDLQEVDLSEECEERCTGKGIPQGQWRCSFLRRPWTDHMAFIFLPWFLDPRELDLWSTRHSIWQVERKHLSVHAL